MAKVLTELPGELTTDAAAHTALLEALAPPPTWLPLQEAGGTAEPTRRLLRDATVSYCAGLRRQAAREAALVALGALLVPDAAEDHLGNDGEGEEEGGDEEGGDVADDDLE